jgi:hypothetical protein
MAMTSPDSQKIESSTNPRGPGMRKRIILLFFYFLFTSVISNALILGELGIYAPLAVFFSWAYVLFFIFEPSFIRLMLFYLLYLSAMFFAYILLSLKTKRHAHFALALFHFLGSILASVIRLRIREESIQGYIGLGIISAFGVIIYLVADWQFAREIDKSSS